MAKVFIKPRKARPFWFGHPWVFSGAVARVKGKVRDGDVVEVVDHEGHAIGEGFYNGQSQIRVRLVSLKPEGPLDASLLIRRLDRAIELRRGALRLDEVTNAYRLVHAEGDGLPGLIADRIGDWIVVQVSALGMAPFLDLMIDRLQEVLRPAGILERPSSVAADEEGLERQAGVLRGRAPEQAVDVFERDVRHLCDPAGGQKTGWFADQRENRLAVGPLGRGLSVLDAFCYTGGFGLRLARDGATAVHGIDSSEPALELARLSAALNGLDDRVTFERGNVLRVLDRYGKEGRTFDMVVLDPPKLVHKRSALERGLALYHEINLKALRVLRRDGFLITCSCSQHVREPHFDEMLGSAAKEAAVRLQEIRRGTQAADHPVLMPLDESRYLKCRVLRVW